MNSHRRTHRIGLALAGVVASSVMALAPAAAEPYPWHNPEAARSVTAASPSKAQIEYHERLAAATAPTFTKAQIERHERLAAEAALPTFTKAQIERQERLAAAAVGASDPAPASSSRSAELPWAALGFLALGAAAVALGILAIRGIPGPRAIR